MLFSVSDSILSKIAKYSAFIACLSAIIVALVILATEKTSEIKRELVTINIDVSNSLNICSPDQDEK